MKLSAFVHDVLDITALLWEPCSSISYNVACVVLSGTCEAVTQLAPVIVCSGEFSWSLHTSQLLLVQGLWDDAGCASLGNALEHGPLGECWYLSAPRVAAALVLCSLILQSRIRL